MIRIVTVYRRLFPYLRPHIPILVLGSVLAVVVAAMEGAVAWLVKPAMDDIFIHRDLTMLRVLPYGAAKAAFESMSAVWATSCMSSSRRDRGGRLGSTDILRS